MAVGDGEGCPAVGVGTLVHGMHAWPLQMCASTAQMLGTAMDVSAALWPDSTATSVATARHTIATTRHTPAATGAHPRFAVFSSAIAREKRRDSPRLKLRKGEEILGQL